MHVRNFLRSVQNAICNLVTGFAAADEWARSTFVFGLIDPTTPQNRSSECSDAWRVTQDVRSASGRRACVCMEMSSWMILGAYSTKSRRLRPAVREVRGSFNPRSPPPNSWAQLLEHGQYVQWPETAATSGPSFPRCLLALLSGLAGRETWSWAMGHADMWVRRGTGIGAPYVSTVSGHTR